MLRKRQGFARFCPSGDRRVIGKVDDLYFDDEDWGIRHLVVNTGSWLSNRKVLISPIARRNWNRHVTKERRQGQRPK